LGDFNASGAADSGTVAPDVYTGGDDSGPVESGPQADAPPPADASMDSGTDSGNVPPSGRPGLDLTAGGNTSASTNYKLIGAVGESPGGNIIVGRSTNYTLKGGVIAGTQ
jgi:hypothetical protein